MQTKKFYEPDGNFIHHPDNEIEIFINDFFLHAVGKSSIDYDNNLDMELTERIRSHYRAGYCWHFANILKAVFQRGEICWCAPFSHIVWIDTDNTPYDIEGIYDGEARYLIPVRYLGDIENSFKHISKESDKQNIAKKSNLINAMQNYCKNNDIKYDPSVEVYLGPEK